MNRHREDPESYSQNKRAQRTICPLEKGADCLQAGDFHASNQLILSVAEVLIVFKKYKKIRCFLKSPASKLSASFLKGQIVRGALLF